ncbi:glycine betaine/L-proline ABC transporter substrate-binding protein ProX [Celerinatantimonas diazotrophica]|uniref:Glycine betaine/proline transport system substrate-binding protein n=1 Tax=Celerinatantimonas diazotrophica TaxID=412034 RepID=A0A4R1K7R2_9GAMM|nr:glycine betaine/L-proline ABC transporter substrate-binding protein ProX [Celerinatantimonas diazotrophica]TCK60348.1 glycine betaine/proline transport system substrate-binding protein [Celerinatantimonas diazotrophica]CAG9295094.1 Glycine betaine/proline betaine-binding periplasmic protein [Celerinatantimonas diazotrophica]
MKMTLKHLSLTATCGIALALSAQATAAPLPGKGVSAQPVYTVQEELFQTLIVDDALKQLGYTVKNPKMVDYNVGYTSIANGDTTFMTTNWDPLHNSKYKKAGGDKVFYRKGDYITGAAQGYLIDKKTADKYHITNIAQLRDPKIAKLFDSNGDGKADIAGCNPGWGCYKVTNYHMKKYGLTKTAELNEGNYSAIIANTIARYRAGKPVIYYTWTPNWVGGVLVPGKDVVWLQVPFTAIPGDPNADTTMPNGKNYGFNMNNERIVANKKWAEQNPAAAKLFAIMKLSVNDVSAENLMMRKGENSDADIAAHAQAWIKAHQSQFNDWIKQAKAAANN